MAIRIRPPHRGTTGNDVFFLKIFGLFPDPPRGVLSWVVAFIVIDILVSFLKIPFSWHCAIQS
jgi:hypothetical protein